MNGTGRASDRPDKGEMTPISTTRIRANLTRVKLVGAIGCPANREAVACGLIMLI